MSKNFNELFDKWAESYDLTVYGENHEYKEVFENYSLILKRIAENILAWSYSGSMRQSDSSHKEGQKALEENDRR